MIADVFHKAALFCRKNRWIYAVTVTGIALLFFTTLFLFANASSDLAAYFDVNPYVNSQYLIRTKSSTEADIKNVLVHLAPYKQNVQEVSLTGVAEMENESGDQSEITVSTYYPENHSGFYVMNGSDSLDKNTNQVLIEYNYGMDTLLSSGYFASGSDKTAIGSISHVRIKGAGDFEVAGFVVSNNASCLGSIICDYDKYYAIIKTTNVLVIQCSTVLNSEEEQQMIKEISSLIQIDEITYPDTANQSVIENYKVTLFMYFGIVMVCLVCSIQLLVHYLNLRDQEFWVYRLLGIPNVHYFGHVLATILAILVPGMLAGAAIFILAGFVIPSLDLFRALDLVGLSYVSAGFFCTSLLLILTACTIQSAFVRRDTVTEDRT